MLDCNCDKCNKINTKRVKEDTNKMYNYLFKLEKINKLYTLHNNNKSLYIT